MSNKPPTGAGDLDRTVDIEQLATTRDSATGAQAPTAWSAYAAGCWARKDEDAMPGEKAIDGVQVYGAVVTFWVRWVAGVTAAMRVNDGGTLYRIVGSAMVGRQQWLQLSCIGWSSD